MFLFPRYLPRSFLVVHRRLLQLSRLPSKWRRHSFDIWLIELFQSSFDSCWLPIVFELTASGTAIFNVRGGESGFLRGAGLIFVGSWFYTQLFEFFLKKVSTNWKQSFENSCCWKCSNYTLVQRVVDHGHRRAWSSIPSMFTEWRRKFLLENNPVLIRSVRRFDILVMKDFFNHFPNNSFASSIETAFPLFAWVHVTSSNMFLHIIFECTCDITHPTFGWWCHFATTFAKTPNKFFVWTDHKFLLVNLVQTAPNSRRLLL